MRAKLAAVAPFSFFLLVARGALSELTLGRPRESSIAASQNSRNSARSRAKPQSLRRSSRSSSSSAPTRGRLWPTPPEKVLCLGPSLRGVPAAQATPPHSKPRRLKQHKHCLGVLCPRRSSDSALVEETNPKDGSRRCEPSETASCPMPSSRFFSCCLRVIQPKL